MSSLRRQRPVPSASCRWPENNNSLTTSCRAPLFNGQLPRRASMLQNGATRDPAACRQCLISGGGKADLNGRHRARMQPRPFARHPTLEHSRPLKRLHIILKVGADPTRKGEMENPSVSGSEYGLQRHSRGSEKRCRTYATAAVFIRHSHSIILSHGNVLIEQRKFFRASQRTVSPIRQKIVLLISNTNFDDTRSARFQRLSTSIGRFSTCATLERLSASLRKNTVSVQHVSLSPPR